MPSNNVATVELYFAWWVPAYIYTLAMFCVVFDCDYDHGKFEYWVSKGIRQRAPRAK